MLRIFHSCPTGFSCRSDLPTLFSFLISELNINSLVYIKSENNNDSSLSKSKEIIELKIVFEMIIV